jgi:thiol-disulfide isomerase/thioredoxin
MRLTIVIALLLAAGCGTPTPPQRRQAGGVELVAAPPTGDVPNIVRGELARASRDGKQLLVYVGATWCEPCRRFHQAAAEHKLDAAFPKLRLLEFDNDRDGERLAMAGYTSQYIPLFAKPGADGRSTGRQIEGSVKGDGAVDQIVPRLRGLLN